MKSQSVCFRSLFSHCYAAGVALCDILEHAVEILPMFPTELVNRSGPKKKTAGSVKSTARSSGKKSVKAAKSAKKTKKTGPKKSKPGGTGKPKKTVKSVTKKSAGTKKDSVKKPKTKKVKAEKTRKESKVKSKTGLKQKPGKRLKEKERIRRRPRIYSGRSSLMDFLIGDQVIFKQVRDWNKGELLHEMRGIVTGMGMDSEQGINYIEVEFEVISFTGIKSLQRRRFAVK